VMMMRRRRRRRTTHGSLFVPFSVFLSLSLSLF
jgi:hypothetical protein